MGPRCFQSIAALKKDLNRVPLSTFADAYTTLMGPDRCYKEYLHELMRAGELCSLPELIFVAECNATRKQEAQFWLELARKWHPTHSITERDFARYGVLDMRSRFSFLRDAYHD